MLTAVPFITQRRNGLSLCIKYLNALFWFPVLAEMVVAFRVRLVFPHASQRAAQAQAAFGFVALPPD
jgi:hypothetical protein